MADASARFHRHLIIPTACAYPRWKWGTMKTTVIMGLIRNPDR